MVDKHGVTHMSQIPEKKAQMIRVMMEYVDNNDNNEVRKIVKESGCEVIEPLMTSLIAITTMV